MDFDVVNFKEDWSFYRVIIFPTKSKLTEAEVNKAKSFIREGDLLSPFQKAYLILLKMEYRKILTLNISIVQALIVIIHWLKRNYIPFL